MALDHIFLYGTLRSECDGEMHRQLVAPFCTSLGRGRVQGKLYDLGRYPGLAASTDPRDVVIGEVFRFNNSRPLLKQLDRYEGCSPDFPPPHEYQRRRKMVVLDSGERISAWVYIYNRRINPRRRIASGDYLAKSGPGKLP